MRPAPRAHDLREIAPGTWSNGHLIFQPSQRRSGRPAWDVVLAGHPAAPVAHLRWNSVWREYALLTRAEFIFAHDCLADIARLLEYLNSIA